MKSLIFSVLVVVAVAAQAEEDKVHQEKRGAVAPASQTVYATDPSGNYAKVSAALAQKTVSYEAAPQYYQAQPAAVKYAAAPVAQQQYYEAAPQAVAYAQPARLAAGPAVQKVAYAPQPLQYSLAGDVSSFSYSSPVVTYNNLGLLTQYAGKGPSQAVAYSAQPVAKQAAYQPAPVQKIAYAAQPVQKVTYATQPTYKTVAQPQYYTAQPQPQQFAYAAAPQQVYQPQYHQPAQTYAQPVYSQAPQYYSAAPQGKYQANPGVTYAQ